ncbi:MAG TPA: LPS assembly protein LptD [Macromonas sp.]|nr:LPS assembly protein LptD [Macromonas sp.]
MNNTFVHPLPPHNAPPPLPCLHRLAAAAHSLVRQRRIGWALLGSVAWPMGLALAQEAPTAPLQLQMSDMLQERLSPTAQEQAPSFVFGDRIHGQTDVSTLVEGQAELRRHDMVLRADRLEHLQDSNTALATGHVRVNRLGNVYEGPELRLKMDTFEGYFLQPRFSILQRTGTGDAERIDFLGKDLAVAHEARYSTCQRPPLGDWVPDWLFSADRIEFDTAAETGTATNGVLSFKGVPILASPWISFPLSDKRKSGVLPPTINLDNQSGLEVTLPYYLNLSPNRDLTLYPTVMSKRGIDLGGEFRYLEREFAGTLRAAYMPSDQLRDANRWAVSLKHQQDLSGWTGWDTLGLNLNLNRVSDDNYWRDFPRTSTELTQRLLPSDAAVNWSQGPWSFAAGVYRWQTLQDVDSPIVAPYDREPSVSLRYAPGGFRLAGLDGWNASVSANTTRFRSDRALSDTDGNGTRSVLVGQLSKTWQTPGWYIKPALQLNLRQYQFDEAYVSGTVDRPTSLSYSIPTLTLDSGMQLERHTSYLGRAFLQTLEPRLYYVHTPYRDQNDLPLYDTAAYDFNLATIYSPNPYTGQDRIADLNTLTLGATSRLLNPETGAEVLSLGIAQRLRFSDQRVTLPGETLVDNRLSDLLVGGRVQWTPQWSMNGSLQFNTENRESVRTTIGMRYTPSNYRVLSAAYRLKRGTTSQPDLASEQLDLGWQWPLSDLFGPKATDLGAGRGMGPGHWYSVGRINYSVPDRKVVDLVAGFEYDGGCWIGRVVLERLQQSSSSANQRILFQLEFTNFSRIGSNPLQTLKDNVPRYQYLREEINPPSRFERYE